MTTPQTERRELSDDEMRFIREVYIRRAQYIQWLVKAIAKGVVASLVLGWATSSIFNSIFLTNPLFWVGLVWGTTVTSGLDAKQLDGSLVKAILTAPMAFKAQLTRRRAVIRKDQADLVERMKEEE